MIDHIGLKVADLEKSRDFYVSALAPLGYSLLMEHEISGAGFGSDGKPNFWLKAGVPTGPIHLAFGCDRNSVVDAFHSGFRVLNRSNTRSPRPGE